MFWYQWSFSLEVTTIVDWTNHFHLNICNNNHLRLVQGFIGSWNKLQTIAIHIKVKDHFDFIQSKLINWKQTRSNIGKYKSPFKNNKKHFTHDRSWYGIAKNSYFCKFCYNMDKWLLLAYWHVHLSCVLKNYEPPHAYHIICRTLFLKSSNINNTEQTMHNPVSCKCYDR